jgi:hypothetical protein
MARELPAGAEWATEPLLDPTNVGKYVHYAWNGNRRGDVFPIVRVGRTNVHVESHGRQISFRHTSSGWYETSGKYSTSIESEGVLQARLERAQILQRIGRTRWPVLPNETLLAVLELVEEQP